MTTRPKTSATPTAPSAVVAPVVHDRPTAGQDEEEGAKPLGQRSAPEGERTAQYYAGVGWPLARRASRALRFAIVMT